MNHVEETYESSGVNIDQLQHKMIFMNWWLVPLRFAQRQGPGGYTSLNDVVTALKNDSDYGTPTFTITDTNGASAAGELVLSNQVGRSQTKS